ncbi:hypothetical protein EAI_05163 [Harpegnathos saltator]|uniref:Uncharacterized protein n=1 Tax=Harpegnathos saltator TaxID=610380 RepID=E2BQ28_HARSA|nr:hypothetical protein EAI_05163 [Harpegnathos saltator]
MLGGDVPLKFPEVEETGRWFAQRNTRVKRIGHPLCILEAGYADPTRSPRGAQVAADILNDKLLQSPRKLTSLTMHVGPYDKYPN